MNNKVILIFLFVRGLPQVLLLIVQQATLEVVEKQQRPVEESVKLAIIVQQERLIQELTVVLWTAFVRKEALFTIRFRLDFTQFLLLSGTLSYLFYYISILSPRFCLFDSTYPSLFVSILSVSMSISISITIQHHMKCFETK